MKEYIEEKYPNRLILYANEVCDAFAISPSTLRRMRTDETLFPPPIKVSGRRIGYRIDQIIQWIEGKWKGVKK